MKSLKDIREEHGMDQVLLARKANVTQQHVSRLEHGKDYLTSDMAVLFGRIFQMEPAEIALTHNLWVAELRVQRREMTPGEAKHASRRLKPYLLGEGELVERALETYWELCAVWKGTQSPR